MTSVRPNLVLITGDLPSDSTIWTANNAREALALQLPEFVTRNRAYIEGDHWEDGKGWIGPKPDVGENGYAETMAAIELAFTSRNVIAEIVDRHKNGVIGQEPRWRFTPKRFLQPGEQPSEQELTDISQLEAMVTGWWDKRKAISVLQQATRNVLFATRGPVRLYVPKGSLTEVNGRLMAEIEAGDLEAALDLIWPEAPDPESATVYQDPDTMKQIGIIKEVDRQGRETWTLCYENPDDPEMTTIRVLNDEENADDLGVVYELPMASRITIEEILRAPLVNEQIIQGQRALNLALSMIPRTVVTAGFLERILLNAQMPGEFVEVKDSSGKVIGKKFVPGTPVFGAGTTNYVAPIAIEEDDGKGGLRTVLTNADVKWREPVDPTFAVNAKVAHYQDILEEANQAHILITSDATPSGNSREQARAEYEASLNETKPHADAVGRWLLEAVVSMAEALAGVPGKYTATYRAIFECNVDTGPLTPDESRNFYDAADRGYLSAQGAMELAKVVDVDSELARIKAEGSGNVGQMVQRATALKLLSEASFPLSVAVKVLGFPEELHAEIVSEMEKQKQQDQDQAIALAKAKPPIPASNGAGVRTGGTSAARR
jgi:hypothetical protein